MENERIEDPPDASRPEPGALPAFPGLSSVTRLGVGGMGSVFRAWQDDLGRSVAVKTVRPDLAGSSTLQRQFAREAHILAQLDHPGIVPVHYFGETDGGPYYVMRLVEGERIDRYLAGARPERVATVFRDIASALGAAHREGVLHRDVKPANILVEPPERAVLVDFGLSTHALLGADDDASELVGTPDFLAPELLDGAEYSPASDLYALGATMYLVLTGRVPFPADELSEKLRAIREDDPPPPRASSLEVPKPLQAICLKAMERSPADRYHSAGALERDLERYLAGDPVDALPIRTRSLLKRKIERHLADCAEWEQQGLLDERQRLAVAYAYETIDEEQRGLLRGVLASVPNLLLLAGLLLTVFGPVLLQLMAWEGLGGIGRVCLPAAPMALLGGIGLRRWAAADRRRGLACLIGAALLAVPSAFGAVDLVPALRTVVDAEGDLHPVLPGPLWLPASDAPEWVLRGARLLEWKVLATAAVVLGCVGLLFRRTRSAFFLWLIGLSAAGVVVPAAHLLGWRDLALEVRWILEGAGASTMIAAGLPLDRRWRRDRALPFYGLGFVWAVATALSYASEGLPVALLEPSGELDETGASLVVHGFGVVAGGLLAHHRGTALLRQVAGVPLVVGFLLVHVGLSGVSMQGGWLWEVLLVVDCVAFLVLGLALHRNSLVLLSAILLPFTIGSVSQRHVDAIWAWSLTVVAMGLALVLLALRLSARRSTSSGPTAGGTRATGAGRQT